MIKLIQHHLIEFRQGLRLSKIFITLILLTFTFITHVLSFESRNEVLIAISMRLYYIPILYSAIFTGFIISVCVSLIVGFAHLFTMLSSENHVHTIMLEHLVETPFLVLLGITAGFLRDVLLFEKNRKNEIVEIFGKYVSPQLVDDIINKKIKIEGEEKEVAILFCDIKNFTNLSEKLKPKDLILLLNSFFSEMIKIVLKNNGFLDKFIGDAMMVVFGIPEYKSDIQCTSVSVAVQMLQKLNELNARNHFGNEKLDITIGIHSGKVVAGNVGSSERREYTIVGDNVNLASRIQNLNKFYKSNLLISDSIRQGIAEEQKFKLREIDSVRVRGKQIPCVIFEVYSYLPEDEISKKEKNLSDFMNGLMYYKSGDFQKAAILFEQAFQKNPDDFICKLYLERIKSLSGSEFDNWDGVYEFQNT